MGDCDLLVAAADPEYRLARLFDYVEDTSQRFGRVVIPRMALSAQNDVRWTQAADAFERHAVKRFSEDFEAGNQTPQHRAQFARARTLTVDCVVYEVNEQGYFKQ